MSDEIINYCRKVLLNHVLIIIICLFVVVYIVINYNIIKNGNIYAGNFPKTFIITGIIFLILYIFMVWDDENEEIVYVPKYKIVNKPILEEQYNENIQLTQPNQELKIENLNTKYIKENLNFNNNDNSNIFISNKNRSKFGIKF
jgi:hypothetical protein